MWSRANLAIWVKYPEWKVFIYLYFNSVNALQRKGRKCNLVFFKLMMGWKSTAMLQRLTKKAWLTLIMRTALRMSRMPSYTRRDASMNSFSSTGSVGFALRASTADSTCSVNRGMTEEGEMKGGGKKGKREKQYWSRFTLKKHKEREGV